MARHHGLFRDHVALILLLGAICSGLPADQATAQRNQKLVIYHSDSMFYSEPKAREDAIRGLLERGKSMCEHIRLSYLEMKLKDGGCEKKLIMHRCWQSAVVYCN